MLGIFFFVLVLAAYNAQAVPIGSDTRGFVTLPQTAQIEMPRVGLISALSPTKVLESKLT